MIKKSILVIQFLILLMGSVISLTPSYSISYAYTFDPEIVFFYPEGLVNGSSFIPKDYIYFALAGDLGDWNENEYVVCYKWSTDETWTQSGLTGFITPLHDIGVMRWDCWHNLTIYIEKYNGKWSKSLNYQFYANKSLIESEPLSITPIHYPNNSVIPHHTDGSYLIPAFKVTGFKLNETLLYRPDWTGDGCNETGYIVKKHVNFTYKWDDSPEWVLGKEPFIREYGIEYVSYRDNVFSVYVTGLTGTHNLSIRLENETHSEIYRFNYTVVDYELPWEFNNFYLKFNEDDLSRRGEAYLSPNAQLILGGDNFNTLVYNWHDGTGNHTVSFANPVVLNAPNFPLKDTGLKYLSFWIENNSIWTPEQRYMYIYDRIKPQINLILPKNDSTKIGMIPLIWSMQTEELGFWDYSQYKFDLYYETPSHPPILLESAYNPIEYETKTKINQGSYWYLRSVHNYYRNVSDPALWKYAFQIPQEIAQETDRIRFIIEETTDSDIPPVISDWIEIKPNTLVKPSDNEGTVSNPSTTTDQTNSSNTSSFNSLLMVLVVFSVVIALKKNRS